MFWFGALWNWLKDTELFIELSWNLHYGCYIIASITVIGSWPNGNKVSGGKPKLKAFLNKLMSPGNKLNSIDIVEISDYFGAKYPACSSIVGSPCFNIFGVRPHQITKWTLKYYMFYLHGEFTSYGQ